LLPKFHAQKGFAGRAKKKIRKIANPFREGFAPDHGETGSENAYISVKIFCRLFAWSFQRAGDGTQPRLSSKRVDQHRQCIVAKKARVVIDNHNVFRVGPGQSKIEGRKEADVSLSLQNPGARKTSFYNLFRLGIAGVKDNKNLLIRIGLIGARFDALQHQLATSMRYAKYGNTRMVQIVRLEPFITLHGASALKQKELLLALMSRAPIPSKVLIMERKVMGLSYRGVYMSTVSRIDQSNC
jgi:hypothetical protein